MPECCTSSSISVVGNRDPHKGFALRCTLDRSLRYAPFTSRPKDCGNDEVREDCGNDGVDRPLDDWMWEATEMTGP